MEACGESFLASLSLLLTNPSTALKPFASHASRATATSKPSFTMSTEGDVFYVYVKRQFVSTVISADECLWKFLLGVRCCLGARGMIRAICKASWVTLMRNSCPRGLRNGKLEVHAKQWNIYKFCISAVIVVSWLADQPLHRSKLSQSSVLRWPPHAARPVFSLGNWSRCRQRGLWDRDAEVKTEKRKNRLPVVPQWKMIPGFRTRVYVLFVFPVLSVSVEGRCCSR